MTLRAEVTVRLMADDRVLGEETRTVEAVPSSDPLSPTATIDLRDIGMAAKVAAQRALLYAPPGWLS